MKYKHVIWDWNGTLLDDVSECVDVLNNMLRKRGIKPLTRQQYQETFDFPVKDFYLDLGFDFNAESFDDTAEEYHAGYLKMVPRCSLHDGTEQVLKAFSDTGLTQSLLSAYQQDRLAEAVEFFSLRDWFVDLIGMEDYYARSKMDNGIRWVNERNYQPGEVLFVGDTVHDYEVAQAMNVDSVLLTFGHNSPERLERCGVQLFHSLQKLSDWLVGAC